MLTCFLHVELLTEIMPVDYGIYGKPRTYNETSEPLAMLESLKFDNSLFLDPTIT